MFVRRLGVVSHPPINHVAGVHPLKFGSSGAAKVHEQFFPRFVPGTFDNLFHRRPWVVTVPVSADDVFVTDSPVIVEGTASPFGEGAQKLTSKNNRRAYKALCNVLSMRDFIDADPHCTEKEWRDECARIGLGGTDNADSQAKAFRRAYANLIDTHFYTNGQKVYLADKTGLSGGAL